ncbi:succinylglutamate desuccinylase/aspartoacylase family protein [Methanobacterium sp.]|uniref:succinylglutamate desuccinylase/aspartoacylase family protein n=1 Tax=Methanobacterium sp. TaxID=2164 RepID=UPI002AB84D4E|nr:succinylglutamate desuccinylase/aspartoacylase family protein [Methanobacterium sp.]MDY9923182.1 succinylglutamate desuccinylase/aspartoacylase family protein [Methanobacterium sp.]
MKKRPSLRPRKKSRSNSRKILMINKKLLVIGALVVLFLCGFGFIITNYSPAQTTLLVNGSEVKSSSNYKIMVIDNSTGGDVSNNTVLFQNINKTPVIGELMGAAKKGTPLIIFGDGSQPRVMLVAGVHGAELPSQIALTNLINHLNGKQINGTVYIIPFAIPNNTATCTRLNNGIDPDREANNPGTPLNSIINASMNSNVTLLVDFHSAQPNDIPGKNCIIYNPKNPKSLELARYISNRSGSPLLEVGPYPGVLSTVSNRNGITSVVCEVLSSHNSTDPGSVELSYQYMLTFLEYSGIYNNTD